MEKIWDAIIGIGYLVLLVVGYSIIVAIYNAILYRAKLALHASKETVVGGGKFSENLNDIKASNEPLQMRVRDVPLSEDDLSLTVKAIEVIGLLPNKTTRRLAFITSILDSTTEETTHVRSVLDNFQEPSSFAYQNVKIIGDVDGGQRFIKWVRAGIVATDIIQPAYRGNRKLTLILRLVDLDNLPPINGGFHKGDPEGMLWIDGMKFEYEFTGKGYAEEIEEREESHTLAIKLAISVALVDGGMDDAEGEKIKMWIERLLSKTSDSSRERLKNIYNESMRKAYSEASSGKLKISDLTKRMNEIGDKGVKYEALELCFDVMGADGIWQKDELQLVRRVAEDLGLDLAEIEKLKDQKIINLNLATSHASSGEEMLGLEEDWPIEKKRRHLRLEFQKWNNRISSLSEGEERENAQKMLNLIAEARKKCA
jgi:tellurite resistance protein